MGSALADVWADWRDGNFWVYDKDQAKAKALADRFNLNIASDPSHKTELAIVAVKPPQVAEVVSSLHSEATVCVAAGIKSQNIQTTAPFIRAMPNISVAQGGGITALYAPPAVDEGLKKQVEALFGFGGKSFWVESESELDIYTAFSGCGPAYVFHFVRALAQAASELGVKDANKLALLLLQGALPLLQAQDALALENEVKSPNGATEAALAQLEPVLSPALKKAMEAALARVKDADFA